MKKYFLLAKKPQALLNKSDCFDVAVDFAIKNLQPGSPVYTHVEILCFDTNSPSSSKIFTMYADEENPSKVFTQITNQKFYLDSIWHALPLNVEKDLETLVYTNLDLFQDMKYSYMSYVKSFYGIRQFYKSNKTNNKNKYLHCASFVARALKTLKTFNSVLQNSEHYYGPSELYNRIRFDIIETHIIHNNKKTPYFLKFNLGLRIEMISDDILFSGNTDVSRFREHELAKSLLQRIFL